MNKDDFETLALVGEKNVHYANAVSGDDEMTMMVLNVGRPNAQI